MGANTLFRSVASHESTETGALENRVEDVRIRNYDETRHRVDLSVTADEAALRESYTVVPGGTRTESDVLDPGQYTVSVTVDDRQHATATCRIEDPAEAIVVEMGNGIVSATSSRY
jgi:hypothetical protein